MFGINFTAGQTLSYRVIAPNGPNTLVTVNQNTPRCNVNDPNFVCTQRCEAEQAGGVRLERHGLHARLRVELPVPGAVRVVLLGVQQVPGGAAGERVCV